MTVAIDVARRLNAPFKFMWPSTTYSDGDKHAITPVREFFSSAYVARHFDQCLDTRKLVTVRDDAITPTVFKEAFSSRAKAGLLVELWDRPAEIDSSVSSEPPDLVAAFKSIEFAPAIARIIDAAKRAVSRRFVAVHARRGDLVYGDYRRQLYNHKYAPAALVKSVFRHLTETGRTPLIFSDDPEIIRILKRDFSVVCASDIPGYPNGSPEQNAMFEIAAMMACGSIVSSGSGFALFPSMASGTKHITLTDYYMKCQARHDILEDLSLHPEDYSTLDRAKAIQYVANQLHEVLAEGERETLLLEASRLDPTNSAYPHILATDYLRAREYGKAEAVLRDLSLACFVESNSSTLSLAPNFNYLKQKMQGHIERGVASGNYPWLTAYASHFASIAGNKAKEADLSEKAFRGAACALLAARRVQSKINARDPEGAKLAVAEALERFPVAIVYNLAGDLETDPLKAAGLFSEAHRLAPGKLEFLAKAARNLQLSGQQERALSAAEEMSSQNHTDPTAWYLSARIYETAGQLEKALACAQRAYDLRPSKPRYHQLLVQLTAHATTN